MHMKLTLVPAIQIGYRGPVVTRFIGAINTHGYHFGTTKLVDTIDRPDLVSFNVDFDRFDLVDFLLIIRWTLFSEQISFF